MKPFPGHRDEGRAPPGRIPRPDQHPVEPDVRGWLADALLGSAHLAPWCAFDLSAEALLAAARDEGVTVALLHRLGKHPCWPDLPQVLTTALARDAKQAVAWEMFSHAALHEVLDALAAAGIDCLLLKGTALAYLLYPVPHARPRGDVDLLVADRATAERALQQLAALGYERLLGMQGRYISHQFACTRRAGNHHVLMIDLHWGLSNSNFFAQRFSFSDLWSERRPVAALGPQAQALSARHALVHALFHRAWHLGEGDPDRLIWLYDIHLLCRSFDREHWRAFVDAVARRGLQPLCRAGLQDLQAVFATPIPPSVDAALAAAPPRGFLNQMHLLQPGKRRTLTDLLSLPSWRQRLGYLRETLFPDADYMRQRFGAHSRWQRSIAYLRRALNGLSK